MNLRDRIGDLTRTVGEFVEDQWFDRTRGIRTAGNVSLGRAGIAATAQGDSEFYQPARPRHIREALRAMPVRDYGRYTFVDLGSGKGRTLFVAAEFPFRRIVGVEFSATLHGRACENIRTYRRRGPVIQSICQNAAEFLLPEDPLVLYMFNPFGAATMAVVLDHLQESLTRHPRHAVVVLLWPRCGEQVARLPGMRVAHQNRYIQIFANGPGD